MLQTLRSAAAERFCEGCRFGIGVISSHWGACALENWAREGDIEDEDSIKSARGRTGLSPRALDDPPE